MIQLPNDEYAQLVGERDSLAVEAGRLRRDNAALLAACHAARRFIVNGVEWGYIQMPDADTPDTARGTLPTLAAAITQAQEPQS